MKTGLPMLACTLPLLLFSTLAAAQSLPAISAGARLAANCAACHGTNGVTDGVALPSLAGQGKGALLVALKAFKAGARQGTIMPQIAKGYTDEQLAQLAEFFAAQPAVPTAALPPVRGSMPVAAAAPAASGVAMPAASAVPPASSAAMRVASAAPPAGAVAPPARAVAASRLAVTGWARERGSVTGSGDARAVLQIAGVAGTTTGSRP